MPSVLEKSAPPLSIQNSTTGASFWVAGNIPTFACNSQKRRWTLSPSHESCAPLSSATHACGGTHTHTHTFHPCRGGEGLLGVYVCPKRLCFCVESCGLCFNSVVVSCWGVSLCTCSLAELSREYKSRGELVWDKVQLSHIVCDVCVWFI